MNNSQSREFKETYKNKAPIAVQTLVGDCSMYILDTIHGVDDFVVVKGYMNDLHKYKVNYNPSGRAYFKYVNDCRYFLDEFVKV